MSNPDKQDEHTPPQETFRMQLLKAVLMGAGLGAAGAASVINTVTASDLLKDRAAIRLQEALHGDGCEGMLEAYKPLNRHATELAVEDAILGAVIVSGVIAKQKSGTPFTERVMDSKLADGPNPKRLPG